LSEFQDKVSAQVDS